MVIFENLTLLLSFVFALALTHLLSSATNLILARDRVRFSGLHVVWMATALVALVVNWLSLAGLNAVKHWTLAEVLLWFGMSVIQYFTCSLVSMRVEGGEQVDMAAFYARHRRTFLTFFASLWFIFLLENFVDRNNISGLSSTAWVGEDLLILPGLILIVIAGVAKPLWLQWTAALMNLALTVAFLATFSLT